MSVSSSRSQPLSYTSSSYAPSTVSRRSSYVPTFSLSLPSLPRSLTSRFIQLMDSIYAILAGLSLRLLLSNLSYSNFKLTGTLVGLWEGVITLHFIKKWPKSSDPYLAYFVRLGIDFMFSESSDSIERMVLVIIWTGLGMVLADIAPSIWRDVGLKRVWRRFRRDLYNLTTMVPTVAFFPPVRTVRFSPSRVPSVIEEEDEDETKSQISQTSPSVIATTELATTTAITPSQISTTVPLVDIVAEPPQRVRRRVPGYFPDDITETESTISSPPPRMSRRISSSGAGGRTSRRLSVFPADTPFTDDEEEHDDLDDANISSTTTGSNMTERGAQTDDIDMTRITVDDIPEIQDEITPVEPSVSEGSFMVVPGIAPGAITIDTGVATKDGETTPKGLPHHFLPPTPSDSAARWTRRYAERHAAGLTGGAGGSGSGDPPPPLGPGLSAPGPGHSNSNADADAQSHHTRPMSAFLPQIPDLETGSLTDNDWHKIQKADLESSNGRAPTPPPKGPEDVAQPNPDVFTDNVNANAPANDAQLAALDAALNLASQLTENQGAPPAYQEPNYMDDDDDMYVDDPRLHQPTTQRFDPYSAGNEAEAWGLGQGVGSVPPATTGPTFNFGAGGARVPAPSFGSNNSFSFGPTSSSFTNPTQPTFEEIERRMAAQEAENARLDEKLRAEQERQEQVQREAEEARRLRAEREEEERKRQEAEAEDLRRAKEVMRKAEEEIQRAAQEAREREEAEAERKRLEKEERRLKEEADDLARKARIAEQAKKEEEERIQKEKEAEEARIAEEEKLKLEKEAKKEERKRQKEEKEEKKRKEKEEAERLFKEEEERLKRQAEEKKEQKKKEREERQRLAQEAADRRAEEEARKKAEAEAERKRVEDEAEAERKKQQEAAAEAEAARKAAEAEEKKRLEEEEETAKRMAADEQAAIDAAIVAAKLAAEEDERQRAEAEAAAAQEAREKEEEDARLAAESQDLDREIQAFMAEEGVDADKTQQQQQQQQDLLQDEVQVSTPKPTPPPQLNELQHPEGNLVDLGSPVAEAVGGAERGEGVEGAGEGEGAGGAEGEGVEGGAGDAAGNDDLADIESITSDMSVVPSPDVGPRLERLIVLRAQKFQLEQQIEELKAKGVGSDNPRMEKLVRVVDKYGKKLMKMWEKGTSIATYADFFDSDINQINLENLNEKKSIEKIEENLERMLHPDAKSLSFTIVVQGKKTMGPKQKNAVMDVRDYYGLFPYTTEDQNNRKVSKTHIPEEHFGEWLAEFRRLLSQKGEQEEQDDNPWGS